MINQISKSPYPAVVWGCDANARLGNYLSRSTEDKLMGKYNHRSNAFRELARRANLDSAQGYNSGETAYATCFAGTSHFARELDYLMFPISTIASISILTLPIPDWDKNTHVHRPIASQFTFKNSGESPPPPRPPPKRTIRIPGYHEQSTYILAGNDAIRKLLPVSLLAAKPHSPLPELITTFSATMLGVAGDHFKRKPPCPRLRPKLFQGNPSILRGVATQLREARKLHDIARNISKRDEDRAQGKALHQRAHAMRKAACKSVAQIRDQRQNSNFDTIRLDSKFYKEARSAAKDTYTGGRSSIPDGPHGTSAADAFVEFYVNLFEKRQPAPPAISPSNEFHQFLPSLPPGATPSSTCGQPITSSEVWYFLYGMHPKLPLPFNHGPTCAPCAELSKWYDGIRRGVAPNPGKILHTSKASNEGDLFAELLCWIRCSNHQQTRVLRMRICFILSTIFNHMLTSGTAPDGFADSTVSFLLKEPKPGAPPLDPTSPSSYRPISILGLLNKIFKTIIAARMAHYILTNRILTPAQIGFLFKHSTADHVFTLTEALKHRRHRGLDSHILFIDFRRAYDSANHELLIHILRKIGIGANLVNLLEHLLGNTHSTLNINGKTTRRIKINVGVPQGDPLSCILFVLYIESLSKCLAATPGIGVTIRNLRLVNASYADDVATISDSRMQTQSAADRSNRWGIANGLQLNTGPGKTNAMAFPANYSPSSRTLLPPPITLDDGTHVTYTTEYTYLGWRMTPGLNSDSNLNSKHFANIINYLTRSSSIARLPISRKFQFMKVMGQAYLACLQPVSNDTVQPLIKHALSAARSVLRLGPCVSHAFIFALSTQIHPYAALVTSRYRFYSHHLNSTYRQTAPEALPLASKLFDVLCNEIRNPSTPPGLSSPSWMSETTSILYGWRDFLPLSTKNPWEHHLAAKSLARAITYFLIRHQTRESMPVDGHKYCGKIHANGTKKHILSLTFNFSAPYGLLSSSYPPISLQGPGFRSLLSIAVKRIYYAVIKAQQGVLALLFYPFCPDERGGGDPHSVAGELVDPSFLSLDDESPDAPIASPASSIPQSEWNSYQPCKLCGAEGCSIFHLISDCPHQAMSQCRVMLFSRLKEVLQRLLNFTRDLLRKDARPSLTPEEDLALGTLRDFSPSSPSQISEVHFILYYVLMGYPWPKRVVPPAFRLASGLGAIFDVTTASDRDLREVADFWLDWSETSLHKLGKIYRNAVAAVSLDPSLRVHPPPNYAWPPPPLPSPSLS